MPCPCSSPSRLSRTAGDGWCSCSSRGSRRSWSGAAWLSVNISAGNGAFGRQGEAQRGDTDRGLAVAARLTRHAVEALELPGAPGRDRFLYLIAAAAVAIVGVVLRQASVAAFGAALTALPILALPAERAFHSIYWHGWELVGYDEALELGASRDSTLASLWPRRGTAPSGLALTLVALVLGVQAARRGRLNGSRSSSPQRQSPFSWEAPSAVGYHELHGRFMMGGVALSAATWGLVRRFRAGSTAVVAVATTTVLLSLVNSAEKPMGIELLEKTGRPSTWTLPREWVQNTQPELAVVTKYVDDHAARGATIGVTRDAWVRPFVYVGYPDIDHRIVVRRLSSRGGQPFRRVGGAPDVGHLRAWLGARAPLAAVGRLPSGSRRQLPIAVRCRGCLRASPS